MKYRASFVAVSALCLGLLADALLRPGFLGVNVSIWIVMFACVTVWLIAGTDTSRCNTNLALCGVIALFGVLYVWRDAPVLHVLNLLAVALLCLTLALPAIVHKLTRTTFCNYIDAFADCVAGVAVGAPLLVLRDLPNEAPSSTESDRKQIAWHILRNGGAGVLIAIPIALVFGGLFVSADKAFSDFISNIFGQNWDWFGEHFFFICFVTWFVAGYARVVGMGMRALGTLEPVAQSLRLNSLTLFVPLTVLNGIFLLFIAVQLQYFFGGSQLVLDPEGPSYSEYARQGFFQLVVVAALAMLVLYASDWMNRESTAPERSRFRAMALSLITMVFVVMASALHRMYLYYDAYGLTRLRFYSTVFMLFLAVTIGWFVLTVLFGERKRFLFGGVASALVFIVGLNAINPDAVIARANIARVLAGKSFDPAFGLTGVEVEEHAFAFAIDAVPELVRVLPKLTPEQRATVSAEIQESMRWNEERRHGDWRVWNLGWHRAVNTVGGL